MSMVFLLRHKQFVMAVTSAASLLTLGDYCAQSFYEKKKSLDDKRSVAACVTGSLLGVESHVWYTFLDRFLAQRTWGNVFKKVLLDQTIAAPIYTLTYILGTSVLEGRTSFHH